MILPEFTKFIASGLGCFFSSPIIKEMFLMSITSLIGNENTTGFFMEVLM